VFTWNDVFGKLGVKRLSRDELAALAVSLSRTLSESRMRQIPHVRFNERGRETERLARSLNAAAPFLDSTTSRSQHVLRASTLCAVLAVCL
jgi:hypothetical protein